MADFGVLHRNELSGEYVHLIYLCIIYVHISVIYGTNCNYRSEDHDNIDNNINSNVDNYNNDINDNDNYDNDNNNHTNYNDHN